jgi:hypothetical protein
MTQAVLDKKIHAFLARKERQYPELAKPVHTLTRELEVQQVSSPLHTYARQVNRHDAKQHFHGNHTAGFHFAV